MAQYSPLNDPAYQAYMRQSSYQKEDRNSRMWEAIGSAQRRWQAVQPQYQDQTRNATSAVDLDYENRGLYRSGARVMDRTYAAQDIEHRRRAAEQDYYEQVYGEQTDAYRDVAQLTMEQGLQEYQARARQQLFEYNQQYGW